MIRLSNYLKFQLTFWTLVPLFYALKERDLPWIWVGALYIVFASTGFLITHLYRSALNKRVFPYDNFKAAAWRVLPALSLLALGVVAFDFAADLFYYKRGFTSDDLYYLTLASYYADGVVIFLPWLFLFHLYHYGRKVGELNRAQIKKQVELQQAQLEAVLSKLNPHFLFNTLNTIRWLISKNPDQARLAISELSDIMRYSTRQDIYTRVTLEEEMSAVKQYLTLEGRRFDTFNYIVTCDPYLLTKKIAPFLILNVVENAISHGISQSLHGGTIEINVFREDESIHISVSNPGTLAKAQQGFGLTSVGKLVKNVFGESSGLSITQQDDRVITTLRLHDNTV